MDEYGFNWDSGYDWAGPDATIPSSGDSWQYDPAADQNYFGDGLGYADGDYSSDPGFMQWLSTNSPGLLSSGANLLGGYLNNQAYTDAANTSAAAQLAAAQRAAELQKFRPVGVTTSFGKSNFGYDQQGNLTSAGYQLAPDIKAQQDYLMAQSNPLLAQFGNSQMDTLPMGLGAMGMFGLGQQYLGTSPQEQAQKYMGEQTALLAPERARAMADLQATMQAQGRGGFAIGGDAGMGAANPQMEALLNSQRMQDLGLAAQATQGGMDYAKFGAGMMGMGGNLLKDMYGTQTAAFQPYQTAMQGASAIENLGQNAMDIGTRLGSNLTAGNAAAGRILFEGGSNAANTQQAGNQVSPWGSILQGAGGALSNYRWGQ